MAKKKKAEKPPREYTRRQLSQWQRQRRRQRVFQTAGISIIAVVILIVVIGWFIGEYRPMHQTVIRVNDTEFNMKYYTDALKFSGRGQTVEYVQQMADATVVNISRVN